MEILIATKVLRGIVRLSRQSLGSLLILALLGSGIDVSIAGTLPPTDVTRISESIGRILGGPISRTEFVGTGVAAIDSETVITAYHVFKKCRDTIWFEPFSQDGEPSKKLLLHAVWVDSLNDQCYLRIDGDRLPPLAVARQVNVAQGDPVHVLGFRGTGRRLYNVETHIRWPRLIEANRENASNNFALTIIGPLGPGMSGGPVLDTNGKLIGTIVGQTTGQDNDSAVVVCPVIHPLAFRKVMKSLK